MAVSDRINFMSMRATLDMLRADDPQAQAIASWTDLNPPQNWWGRFNSYLSSLRQLTSTRRRLDRLEQRIQDLIALHTRRMQAQSDVFETWSTAFDEGVLAECGALRHTIAQELSAIHHRLAERDEAAATQLAALSRRLDHERLTRQKAFSDFERALRLQLGRTLPQPEEEAKGAPEVGPALAAHMAAFYYYLEERYRGTREEIRNRLGLYLQDLAAARERVGDEKAAIDLGCGRGELVELLRDHGFRMALGIDTNDVQLEEARRRALPVVHEDALGFLRRQRDGSAVALCAIHVVEHLPFLVLLDLCREAARVLDPRGVLIFETPNPRNLIVGATTFHLDPTHMKPLPPEVLSIALETAGFESVEVRLLHPSCTYEHATKVEGMNPHLAALLYGPQDYAVIARVSR